MRLLTLILLFGVVSCDSQATNFASLEDLKTRDFSVMCIGGVQYWARVVANTYVLTPKYNPVSKQVRTCEGEDGLMKFSWPAEKESK